MADESKGQDVQPEGKEDAKKVDAKGEGAAEGKAKVVDGGGPDDQITPARLKGVLEARDKKILERMSEGTSKTSKTLEALQAELSELAKKFESREQKDQGGEKAQKKMVDAGKFMEMEKEIERLNETVANERKLRLDAETRSASERFERTVVDALVRARCKNPKRVFRAIKEDFKVDDDGKISAPYHDEKLGDTELDLDAYIAQVVRLKELPDMFEGGSRTGASTSGERIGPDGRQYKFTQADIKDTKFYADHRKEILDALERGEVEPAESAKTGSARR